MLNGTLDQAFCIIVSGQVSHEIVSKTYRAGIPVLAAVSALFIGCRILSQRRHHPAGILQG